VVELARLISSPPLLKGDLGGFLVLSKDTARFENEITHKL
jgi:hypothetical protein